LVLLLRFSTPPSTMVVPSLRSKSVTATVPAEARIRPSAALIQSPRVALSVAPATSASRVPWFTLPLPKSTVPFRTARTTTPLPMVSGAPPLPKLRAALTAAPPKTMLPSPTTLHAALLPSQR